MSASLLEYFRAGPPAPKVVLLPDTHFFARTIPITDAATPDDAAAQVELALETLAPFPIEHMNHGFYWTPGATQALAFAAYRRRFPVEQTELWTEAELVMPTFVALCGMAPAPATTVIVPGENALTAVHWNDSPVPASVLTRILPPEATDEDRARVRDELLREIGGTKKVVEIPATPVITTSPEQDEYHFQAGDTILRLPTAQNQWLDVRPKDELAVLRKARSINMMLWRILLGCMATLVLLTLGELALVGGRMWQKTRHAKVIAQSPVVEKTKNIETLTQRIDERSTQRLLPFEMLQLLKGKRSSIQFKEVIVDSADRTKIEIKAQAPNPADFPAYQTALNENPAIAKVELRMEGSNSNMTVYLITVFFKPEALKPATP